MRVHVQLSLFALFILLTACKQNSAQETAAPVGGGSTEAIHQGPGNGGGGDPRVAAFLSAASYACAWMQMESDLNSKAAACRTELADLSASVNNPKRMARVYSDELPALDHGVAKDAVTDLDSRRIHLNIKRWEGESSLQHQITAAMEMALLLGIPDRYNLGKRLSASLASSMTTVSPEEFAAFQKWAYKHIEASDSRRDRDGSRFAVVQGQTEDKTPCALFLTDTHRDLKEIYLSLGVGREVINEVMNSTNYYIGGVVWPKCDLQMDQHKIRFRAMDWETVGHKTDGSPIAEFSDRRLAIELSDSGEVLRVTGTTSRLGQGVVCNIKM